jgi:hypothetical protein
LKFKRNLTDLLPIPDYLNAWRPCLMHRHLCFPYTRLRTFLFYHGRSPDKNTIFIYTLLLSAIAIYGFANYYSLKKTILILGKERLSYLTRQIAAMLGNNATSLINAGN